VNEDVCVGGGLWYPKRVQALEPSKSGDDAISPLEHQRVDGDDDDGRVYHGRDDDDGLPFVTRVVVTWSVAFMGAAQALGKLVGLPAVVSVWGTRLFFAFMSLR
jgi:hypothetical protein